MCLCSSYAPLELLRHRRLARLDAFGTLGTSLVNQSISSYARLELLRHRRLARLDAFGTLGTSLVNQSIFAL